MSGATGFVGRHLLQLFEEVDPELLIIKRQETDISYLSSKFKHVESVNSDECLSGQCSQDFSDISIFIHLATCYGRDGQTDEEVKEVNYDLGKFMLNLALESGTSIFFNIDTALPKHANRYAYYKNHFKNDSKIFVRNKRLNFVNLVLENVYGPGDISSTLIPSVINACKRRHSEIKLSHGAQKRDFLFIEDAAMGIYTVISNIKFSSEEKFRDIAVSSGNRFSIGEVAKLIKTLTQSKIKLKFDSVDYNGFDEDLGIGDPQFLRSLGWQPTVSLREGLLKTISDEDELYVDG